MLAKQSAMAFPQPTLIGAREPRGIYCHVYHALVNANVNYAPGIFQISNQLQKTRMLGILFISSRSIVPDS